MPSPLPADASPASFMLALTSHLTPTLAFTTHPPTSPLSSPRYDLAFLAPFKLEELPRAQLWLPGQCCEWTPDPLNHAVPHTMRAAKRTAEQACLGRLGRIMDLCRTSYFLNTKGVGPAYGKFTLVREAERNMFVNDWFFIAPSRTADTWANLYHNYKRYIAALKELGATFDPTTLPRTRTRTRTLTLTRHASLPAGSP